MVMQPNSYRDPLPRLSELLPGYSATAVKRMFSAATGQKAEDAKALLIRRLAADLAEPSHIHNAVSALDATALAVFERVHRIGRPVDWYTLSSVLAADGLTSSPRKVSQRPSRRYYGARETATGGQAKGPPLEDLQHVLTRLEVAGLVLGGRRRSGSGSVTELGESLMYCVPHEVAEALDAPSPVETQLVPEPRHVENGDADAFSRELYYLWSYAWTNRPRLLANKDTLSKRDMKALAKALPFSFDVSAARSEMDVPRLHSDRLTLHGLELMRAERHLEVDVEAARRFWSEPVAVRCDRWLTVYQKAHWINELCDLGPVSLVGDDARHPSEGAPAGVIVARAAVLVTAVTIGVSGAWMSFGDLSRALWLNDPAFLNPGDLVQYSYHYSSSTVAASRYEGNCNARGWGYHPLLEAKEMWENVECRFAAKVLGEAHRLGFFDLGYDDSGELVAFRLNPTGVAVVTGKPRPTDSSASARVVVQPNFRILALGQLPEITLMDLDRVSDRVSVDRATEYELTRSSVYRAQQMGTTAAQLIEWLSDISAEPLPQNVTRSLEEWQDQHERIVIHERADLLHSSDEALLADLVEQGPGVLRLLSPSFALVEDAEELSGILGERQLRPVQHEFRRGAPGANLDGDGYVSFRQQVPDIDLLGRVQRLTEWDKERGAWRLTRGSVSRAKSRFGLDAAAQALVWDTVLESAPPEWLEKQLQAWSGFYADATFRRVVLLELPSQQALEGLRQDERLKNRLEELKPKGPVVLVTEDELDELGELLSDYGIQMPDE